MLDKVFIWNPSNSECEPDKSYLDHKNCECRQRIAGELVEECSKNIDENKLLSNETLNTILLNTILLNDYRNVCGSCVWF